MVHRSSVSSQDCRCTSSHNWHRSICCLDPCSVGLVILKVNLCHCHNTSAIISQIIENTIVQLLLQATMKENTKLRFTSPLNGNRLFAAQGFVTRKVCLYHDVILIYQVVTMICPVPSGVNSLKGIT